VDHRRYRGVRLTESGRRIALEMLRHHRLLETYLAKTLGYDWAEVHDEAERLEHVISERFEARIAEALGHPTHDPHGDPIPDAELCLPERSNSVRLRDVAPGSSARVVRVAAQDAASLLELERLGVVPGAVLEVVERAGSAVEVTICGRREAVSDGLAEHIWMEVGP
jgi:DtxR family Mn-dependent transcriptional regulator